MPQITTTVLDQVLAVETNVMDENLLLAVKCADILLRELEQGFLQEVQLSIDVMNDAIARAQAALGRLQGYVAGQTSALAVELQLECDKCVNAMNEAFTFAADLNTALIATDQTAAIEALQNELAWFHDWRTAAMHTAGVDQAGYVTGLRQESEDFLTDLVLPAPVVEMAVVEAPRVLVIAGREQIVVRQRTEAEVAWNAALLLKLAVEAARLRSVQAAKQVPVYTRKPMGMRLSAS